MGKRSSVVILLFVFFCVPQHSYSQAYFTLSGASLNCTISQPAYVNICGHLTNSGNATLNNNGQIFITGNINNSSSFSSGISSNTKFYGSSNQSVTTNALLSFYNAEITNPAGVSLSYGTNNDIQINNILTLTVGVLYLNENSLIINNSSVAGITRVNGYIKSEHENSKVQWNLGSASSGNYVFPFAYLNAASSWYYIPFKFDISAAGSVSSSPASLTIATYHTPNDNLPMPSGVTNINSPENSDNMVDRYYLMSFANYSSNPHATLNFYYDASNSTYELNSLSESSLKAQRWRDTYWDTPEGTYASHYVSVPSTTFMEDYLPWVLVNEDSPLPVELISFYGYCINGNVELSWSTASEQNNDFFIVECSLNGFDFVPVGSVIGAGNSNSIIDYFFHDTALTGTQHYYRLQQTDFDGTSSYSHVIVITCESSSFDYIDFFPSPADQILNCHTQLSGNISGNIIFYDALGRIAFNESIDFLEGSNTFPIDISSLKNGIYHVLFISTQKNGITIESSFIKYNE